MAIVLALLSYDVYAMPGESIALDPNSGNYTVFYYGSGRAGHKPLRSMVFVPATKIVPRIDVTFKLGGLNLVAYNYTISNEGKSKQPIESIIIDPVADIVSKVDLPKQKRDIDLNTIAQINQMGAASLLTPAGWVGRTTTSREGGLRIGWGYEELVNDQDGLQAGATQSGFGFLGLHIPGLGIAQVIGNAGIIEWPDEGPTGEVGDRLTKLEQNNFVPVNVAVPTIAVPVPFDAAILIDRIRTQVATWPGKQLLDPAFAAQLDRYMVAAANAYRNNQPKAGKEHIESLRKMLDREHKYLDHDDEDNDDTAEHKAAVRLTIDRLAARVLDFDLRYVLNRTEHEHEHEHEEGDRWKERN